MESQIGLEGMCFYARHGVHESERELGGRFEVDIYLFGDFSQAGKTDQLKHTVDYELVYRIIEKEMATPSNLLEHVCERIGFQVRSCFPGLSSGKVRISKISAPIGGVIRRVFVETTF